jgi:hypothetical protein
MGNRRIFTYNRADRVLLGLRDIRLQHQQKKQAIKKSLGVFVKRFVTLFVSVFVFCGTAFAVQYEDSMLNLSVPSGLEPGQAYFNVGHKLFYDFSQYKRGSDDIFVPLLYPANIDIGLRYMFIPGLEISARVFGFATEKVIAAGYSHDFSDQFIKAKVEANFFSYDLPLSGNSVQNLNSYFYLATLQSHYILDRLSLTADAGYNMNTKETLLGAGASLRLFQNEGELVNSMNLIYEIYPCLKDGVGRYSVGLKIMTHGHQFMLFLGNSEQQGIMNAQSDVNDDPAKCLRFGFNIQRLIQF